MHMKKNNKRPETEAVQKKNVSEASEDAAVNDAAQEAGKDTARQAVSGTPGETEGPAPESGALQLEAIAAERDAAKDQMMRIAADFENYKKRSAREYEDFKKFSNESLVKALLPAIDNLERAIESAGNDANNKGIVDGVKMTLEDVMKTFEKFNVLPVAAEGETFNPMLHQAVMQEEADGVPANQVLKVLQNGYTMNERLLRPAMVVVSRGPVAAASSGNA